MVKQIIVFIVLLVGVHLIECNELVGKMINLEGKADRMASKFRDNKVPRETYSELEKTSSIVITLRVKILSIDIGKVLDQQCIDIVDLILEAINNILDILLNDAELQPHVLIQMAFRTFNKTIDDATRLINSIKDQSVVEWRRFQIVTSKEFLNVARQIDEGNDAEIIKARICIILMEVVIRFFEIMSAENEILAKSIADAAAVIRNVFKTRKVESILDLVNIQDFLNKVNRLFHNHNEDTDFNEFIMRLNGIIDRSGFVKKTSLEEVKIEEVERTATRILQAIRGRDVASKVVTILNTIHILDNKFSLNRKAVSKMDPKELITQLLQTFSSNDIQNGDQRCIYVVSDILDVMNETFDIIPNGGEWKPHALIQTAFDAIKQTLDYVMRLINDTIMQSRIVSPVEWRELQDKIPGAFLNIAQQTVKGNNAEFDVIKTKIGILCMELVIRFFVHFSAENEILAKMIADAAEVIRNIFNNKEVESNQSDLVRIQKFLSEVNGLFLDHNQNKNIGIFIERLVEITEHFGFVLKKTIENRVAIKCRTKEDAASEVATILNTLDELHTKFPWENIKKIVGKHGSDTVVAILEATNDVLVILTELVLRNSSIEVVLNAINDAIVDLIGAISNCISTGTTSAVEWRNIQLNIAQKFLEIATPFVEDNNAELNVTKNKIGILCISTVVRFFELRGAEDKILHNGIADTMVVIKNILNNKVEQIGIIGELLLPFKRFFDYHTHCKSVEILLVHLMVLTFHIEFKMYNDRWEIITYQKYATVALLEIDYKIRRLINPEYFAAKAIYATIGVMDMLRSSENIADMDNAARICASILLVLLEGTHNDISKPKFDIELLHAITQHVRNDEPVSPELNIVSQIQNSGDAERPKSSYLSRIRIFSGVIGATYRLYAEEKIVADAIATNTIAAAVKIIVKIFEKIRIEVHILRKSVALIEAVHAEILHNGNNESTITYHLAAAASEFIASAITFDSHNYALLEIANDLIIAALKNVEMFVVKVDQAKLQEANTKSKELNGELDIWLIYMFGYAGRVRTQPKSADFFLNAVRGITSIISELCGLKPSQKKLKIDGKLAIGWKNGVKGMANRLRLQ